MNRRQQIKTLQKKLECCIAITIWIIISSGILIAGWNYCLSLGHPNQVEKYALLRFLSVSTLVFWLIGGLLNNYHASSKRAIKPSQTALFYLAGMIGLMITSVIYFFSLRNQIRELYS